jgi:hypothetical protein
MRSPFDLVAPPRRSIVELIRQRVLDAELAALAWLLVEARLPVIVAADAWRIGKTTLLEAVLDFLPPSTRRIELAGAAETFAWLPEAASLGWHGAPEPTGDEVEPATPETAYIVARELSDHLPVYVWDEAARVAIRATSLGYGLGATIHADSLEDVFAQLGAPAVGLTADELSWLGLVIVLRPVEVTSGLARRVVAAHYVRPVARDAHGHVQRLGPAVLATRDPRTDSLEHFAWGVIPELALRTRRKAGDFEVEHDRRAEYLTGLVAGEVLEPEATRLALAAYRSPAEA